MVRRYDGRGADRLTVAVATQLFRNLSEGDDRARLCRAFTRPVAVYDVHAEAGATVKFTLHGATVYNGIAGRPAVVIAAPRQRLRALPRVTVRWWTTGLTLLTGRCGRYLVRSVFDRDVRIHGLLLHPLIAARALAMLASPILTEEYQSDADAQTSVTAA